MTYGQCGSTLTIKEEIPQPLFKRNMQKEERWELEEGVVESIEAGIGSLEFASSLYLTPFLYERETSIPGDEMRERAERIDAMFSQQHAEWLLDHQDQIQKEWRGYFILFPGTVWRDRSGGRHVPYLWWDGRRWGLLFGLLDCRFFPPFVLCARVYRAW